MKVGNLVQRKPSRTTLDPRDPYIYKIGIVVEQNAPGDEYDKDAEATWWVQWQGNSDWDKEWEGDLQVLS